MPLKSPNLEVQLQERAVKGLPRWKNNRQNWSKTPHGTADNVRVTNINYCRMWERKTAGQVEGEVNMEGQWMKAVFSLGHRTLSNNCPEKAKNWGCLTQGRGREAVKEQRHTDREGINQPTSTHTNRQWGPFWQNTHTNQPGCCLRFIFDSSWVTQSLTLPSLSRGLARSFWRRVLFHPHSSVPTQL